MNNNKKYLQILAVLFLVTITSGCATKAAIVTSYEDLASDHEREGFFEASQYRVISIPGWLPFSDVGKLYFYKPKRKPSTAVGISADKSYSLLQTIDAQCDFNCLAEINEKIADLDKKALGLIRARADVLIAKVEQLNQEQKGNKSSPTQVTTAAADVLAKTTTFDDAYDVVKKALLKPGVFMYRWTNSGSQSGGLGLGKLFGIGGSKQQTNSGYAIVSGLQTRTLFLGKDIVDSNPFGKDAERVNNNFELTTHNMQGKHIIYSAFTDYSAYASAYLKASSAQLANLPETLKSLDSIELEARVTELGNLSNTGAMSGMKRTKTPIDWTDTNLNNIPAADEGWQTFFAVTTDYKDILEIRQKLQGKTDK